jgi:hypothetical protein
VVLELVRLVDHGDGHLLELLTVLASVVGAEKQLTTGLELDTEVGLGTAAVATVLSSQRGAGGNGSRHFGLISLSVGVFSNVARESKIPSTSW